MTAPQRSGGDRPRPGSLQLSLLLLGLWTGIELLAASRWLEIDAIRQRLASLNSPPDPQRPSLRHLLAAIPRQQRRVWFAPYLTFPEAGQLESRNHRGVYDTFLAFPRDGLRTNYGAYKLSPADSLFAQASSQGLGAEARLARTLGYRWFAIDRAALQQPAAVQRLCVATPGCRSSSDGHALFRLDREAERWIGGLAGQERRVPLLPQSTAAPRWGGLVFDPIQWWSPTPASIRDGDGAFRFWAQPLWQMRLFRHDTRGLSPPLRQILAPPRQQVQLLLAPALGGVQLCIGRSEVMARHPDRCHPLELTRQRPTVTITPWLEAGTLTTIAVRWIFDAQGLPLPARLVPPVAANAGRPSAVAITIRPGIGDQLLLPPSP
ncbi:MAG: hypothetical protein ACKOXO_09925 [Cyanobium sp.]